MVLNRDVTLLNSILIHAVQKLVSHGWTVLLADEKFKPFSEEDIKASWFGKWIFLKNEATQLLEITEKEAAHLFFPHPAAKDKDDEAIARFEQFIEDHR